jgi:hypothetical protein
MSQETTYAGILGDLERLIAALFANAGDLPHLEGTRLRMEQLLEGTRQVLQEQAGLIASKQAASRQVERLIGDSQRTITAVRKLLRAHYGLDAEKLAEFGVQPFRGRNRRTAPGLPPPEIDQPAASVEDTNSDS